MTRPPSATPPALPERYQPWPDPERALLGRGGASEVWRVQDRQLGILVALKVLRTEGARLAGRLEREAVVSASVVHPNVIALHDMGRTPDGRPYLAFALASDGSMLDHAGTTPAWPELREQVIGLLDALGALHARGLLHLDVKLSNLLLHRTGPQQRVLWLADLGVARARWSQDEDEGLVLGTVGYMAPERLTGQSQLWGPPTDLFSVGAVLYRMLSGELPFPAKDPVEALASRQRPPTQVPVREGLVVPAGLEPIVLAMLQPDRRSRYDLAADVSRAIHALPDPERGGALGRPLPGQPPRLALMAEIGEDSLVEWPPRDQTAPRPIGAALAERGGGLVWHQPPPLRPPRHRPRPYVPRRVPQDPRLVAHREIPVTGRDAELDQLWAAARAVIRTRRPVLVCLGGARGMGRTRLVDELTRTLERVGIAQGVRLDFAGREGPAQGLDGALRRLLPPLQDPRSWRNDIARTLSRMRDTSPAACRHDAAALADVVSPRPGGLPADRTIARSFVVEHLAAHAWRGLSWLWLDDVHMAGEADDAWSIVDILFASRAPALVIASYADLPEHRGNLRPLRRLEARYPRRTWRIQLDALPPAEARKLAHAHLPMDEELAGVLARTTGGHPRYMHELIVHMVRQEALVPGGMDPSDTPLWTLAAQAPPLPRDALDFARQRLALAIAQDPPLGHALRVVRLAGTGAPERVVARVVGDALDRLVTLGLVHVGPEGLHIDSPELKEAVSELAADPGLDGTIHDNLAAAWAEEGEDPMAEARGGLHLALAGRPAEALARLRRALRRLQGSLRPQPLARVAARTMDLAEQAGAEGQEAWAEAALVQSEALWALGRAEDALRLDDRVSTRPVSPALAVQAACLHALHLAAQAGPPGADAGLARLGAVEDALPHVPSPVRASFHAARAALRAQRLERQAALDEVEAALAYAPRPDTQARALLLRAELLLSVDAQEAARAARQVQALSRQHGLLHAEIEAWDLLGRLAVREGRTEETVAELEAGIVRLRRVGERTAAGHLLATLGAIHLDAGNLEAARSTWTDALTFEATGREGFARVARLGLAKVAAILGDGPRVRALAELATRAGEPPDAPRWALLAALGAMLCAEPAAPLADEALERAARAGPEDLLLVELLLLKRVERGEPRAEELLDRVRRAAEQAGVDRRGVDPLLVRAAMG